MITGNVVAGQGALVTVALRGRNGVARTVAATIDTGFNGYLVLPPDLIASLGLVWHGDGNAVLADGTQPQFPLYQAYVQWGESTRRVVVACLNSSPLIGLAMMRGYRLMVDVIDGGAVHITRLPAR